MTSSTPPKEQTGFGRVQEWVVRDTSAGLLLILAAVFALAWANSPLRGSYTALSQFTVGPSALHLDLSLSTWAADGLLAIFFFTVGLELKQEFVAGSLRSPKQAALPMIAAVGGMAAPALIFTAVVLGLGQDEAAGGWAIPTATDIAFAVGVLALFGKGAPRGVRTFLLTLAVVDDLLAIVIIALFYTEETHPIWLLVSFAAVIVFAVVARTRRAPWWLLVPLAFIAWAAMHASGVHATIAGVLLGFMVPAVAMHGEQQTRTHRYNSVLAPFTNGFVLPVFAFFAAGVNLVDGGGPAAVIGQPVVLGIAGGLVVGKFIGVLGTTALFTAVTPLTLPDNLRLKDMLPVGFLTGIGFTVSLLIAELSFPSGTALSDGARIAVLIGTLIAAVLSAITLRSGTRKADPRRGESGIDEDSNRVADDPGVPGTGHHRAT